MRYRYQELEGYKIGVWEVREMRRWGDGRSRVRRVRKLGTEVERDDANIHKTLPS
jgi:hypothetical protein